jgi:hypothetical protein
MFMLMRGVLQAFEDDKDEREWVKIPVGAF